MLCGYPSEQQQIKGNDLECGVLTTFTERLQEIPNDAKSPVDATIDLFFKYAHVAVDEDGDIVRTPHLRSASGAAVWEYTEPSGDGLWTPDKSVKVVAVQASAMDGDWFRATNWNVVKHALTHIDDELRAAVLGRG